MAFNGPIRNRVNHMCFNTARVIFSFNTVLLAFALNIYFLGAQDRYFTNLNAFSAILLTSLIVSFGAFVYGYIALKIEQTSDNRLLMALIPPALLLFGLSFVSLAHFTTKYAALSLSAFA